MQELIWVLKLFNEGIPLIFLAGLGFFLYRGMKRNQAFLSEREALLKRYLLFRGNRQVRLKMCGEDEKVYHELLKNLSNSWKNFKKSHNQCLASLAKNTRETWRLMEIVALGLLINSLRVLLEEYSYFGVKTRFIYTVVRELSYYVPVILGFLLLRTQTHQFLSPKGEAAKMERDILFFPNDPTAEGEQEGLYNEFDPLIEPGAEDEKEDPNPRQ